MEQYVNNQLFVTYKKSSAEQEKALCDEFTQLGYQVHVFNALYKGDKFLALFAPQEMKCSDASELETLVQDSICNLSHKDMVLGVYKVGFASIDPPKDSNNP